MLIYNTDGRMCRYTTNERTFKEKQSKMFHTQQEEGGGGYLTSSRNVYPKSPTASPPGYLP